jgi:hypothetical protein
VRTLCAVVVAFCALSATGACQTSNDFWSEIDTYIGLSPRVTLFLMAASSTDRDTRDQQLEVGPNLDLTLLPFLRPRLKSLNPEKNKYLTFRTGYRYLTTVAGAPLHENRGVLELTARFPLPVGLELSERNRIDLRGLQQFSWRYRNQVTLERSFQVRRVIFTPYLQAEIFYDSLVSAWNRNSYAIGSTFRVCKRLEVEPYVEHQNNIREPVSHLNAEGLTMKLYVR